MFGGRDIFSFYLRLAALLLLILFGSLLWAILRTPMPRVATVAIVPPTSSLPPPVEAPPPATLATVGSLLPQSRNVDPELTAAAAKMVLPPPGTPLAYAADPRALSAIMQRGLAIYEAAPSDGHRAEGARLIQIAAVLGFEPARNLIARDYARVRVVRWAAAAPDAIRYALDPFADGSAPVDKPELKLVALARYFAERRELEMFATHLLEAVRDDRRLQVLARLDLMLESLRPVPDSCASVARVVSAGRLVPECSPPLGERVLTHARNAGPVGRDHNSRRQALVLLREVEPSR